MTRTLADSSKPSPVDQILAAPSSRALLDSHSAEPVPRWMWLLPVILLLPGGIIGWLLVRDSNRSAGRVMLVVGLLLTVATMLTAGPTKDLLGVLGGAG